MARTQPYVALLRGINVGGKNLIKMADLKKCFEDQGFQDVETYIQSGNVLFRPGRGDAKSITHHLEDALSDEFGYDAKVILRSRNQLHNVVEKSPPGWGEHADYRYNVLFLKEPLTPARAHTAVEPKPEIEKITRGPGVLYWSVDAQKGSRSTYAKLSGKSIYPNMTIRNHNTVTNILAKLDNLGKVNERGP